MAGTYLKLADNARTILNGSLTADTTEVVVTSVSDMPSTYPYILTIWDGDTYDNPGDDSSMEKVLVTSGVTTTLTVTRGYDGTTGVIHATAEYIALLSTSAILEDNTYGVETVLDTHLDNSSIHLDTDTVKDTHIDWGTGASQISAVDMPIADAGTKITATEVEGALQENRSAIDLNTAKDTNVSTDLSEGTSTETTVDVNSSDGTNATLVSASASRAGLLTKAKFDEVVANTTHKTSDGSDHSFIDQDVIEGSAPTLLGTNITAIPTENIMMCEIGTATYDSVHDLINNTQSSGIIEGFELSNSRTALELDMAAGKGYLKITDSPIAETCAFDIPSATEDITLSSGMNYLYIDYNAGTPQVVATTDRSSIEYNRQFTIGRVLKDAENGLHILNSGTQVSNLARTEHERLIDVYGFQHVEGAVLSEVGTLNLDITAGVWYSGHNKLLTNWINTDTEGDTFKYQHYGTSSWIVDNAVATDIDCTHYNDGDDTLGNLIANAYGVQWVYIAYDNHVNIIYGTENGALAVAQASQPPTSLQPEVAEASALIGKIIVRQTGVITSIESTLGVSFTSSGIIDHNDTGGLNDGDYKHLTAAEKTLFDTVEENAAADQTASEVPIVDSGAKITATEVEGALQENRTAIDLNTAKDTNVSTDLSEGTSTETTVDVNSSDGTNATLVAASTSRAGVLTKAKFDEIVANNAKVTNATHSGDVTGDGELTIATDAVTYAKMQNIVNDERIWGRVSGADGVVEELTKTQVLTMLNVADGADVTSTNETSHADVLVDGDIGVTVAELPDDTAYNATSWDGNSDAATKNSIRDKIESMSAGGTTITAQSFSSVVSHATTDEDAGKAFTIASFPAHCQITKIRVRADWTAGQQSNTGSALVNNGSGIAPGGTTIAYDNAVADFAVNDYIWIDDECFSVSADTGSSLTVAGGKKGTMEAFHDDNATIVKANHGVRLVLFKDTNRNYSERIIELSSIMTYKGVTDALISANDDYFGLTADIQNIGHNDFIVIEDTADEICRVQNVNHDTVSATYDYTIFVQDDLAAHDTTKDVKKLMVYDLDTPYDSGTTLYGTVFIDENIGSTVTVDVETFTDSYT